MIDEKLYYKKYSRYKIQYCAKISKKSKDKFRRKIFIVWILYSVVFHIPIKTKMNKYLEKMYCQSTPNILFRFHTVDKFYRICNFSRKNMMTDCYQRK